MGRNLIGAGNGDGTLKPYPGLMEQCKRWVHRLELQSGDVLGVQVKHAANMHAVRHVDLDTALGADSIALLGDGFEEDGATVQRAVVGTYSLRNEKSESPSREGRLLVVSASRRENAYSLTLDGVVRDIPGVLDVAAQATPRAIYAACAEDSLLAFDVRPEEQDPLQMRQEVCDAEDHGRIVLSVDVCEGAEGSEPPFVAASDSAGGISLYRAMRRSWEPVLRRDTHAEEAWSVCVDGPGGVLYSGGDDGALVCWDWEAELEPFRLRKAHDGVGVTAVTKDRCDGRPEAEFQLWTGGYDDTLRLWDVRSMKRSVAEVGVGGGVWRVRFHPLNRGLLLLATMYDGFKVVRRQAGSDQLSVACHYQGHQSLAYGATWVPSLDNGDEHVAMTSSFYDHSLQLWAIEDPT